MELRWVHRGVPALGFGPGVERIVPVLQYRTLEHHVGDGYDYSDWTPWTDVPTTQEADK